MGEHDELVERDEYDRQRLREDEGLSHCYEPSGLTPSDTTSRIYGSRASPGDRWQPSSDVWARRSVAPRRLHLWSRPALHCRRFDMTREERGSRKFGSG